MCKLGENVSFYIMVKTSAAQFQHDKKNLCLFIHYGEDVGCSI